MGLDRRDRGRGADFGPRLWRLTSGRGGTGARPFVVGELPEFIERETNSTPERAEALSLPVTVNGQIAGERDVDYFRFAAEAGETVTIDVAAARLGSPLEAVVELSDSHGRRVKVDELRAGGDPVLVFRAAEQWRVPVVRGESRLSWRSGVRVPHHADEVALCAVLRCPRRLPPARRAIELFCADGSGGLSKRSVQIAVPAAAGLAWLPTSPAVANAVPMEIVATSTIEIEREPNDARQQATPILPDTIASGQLATSTDEDWYGFAAHKDESFAIDCRPAPRSSPTLPVVSIVGADGATLAAAKATESPDRVCRLDWRAPADGEFYLRVVDVERGAAGGAEFVYTLSLARGRGDFALAAKVDFVNVVQGGRAELDLAVMRRAGFNGPIELSVAGLPEGLRFEPREIAAGQQAVKIAFIVEEGARPTAADVRVVGTATIDGARIERVLVATHLGHDADRVGVGPSTLDNLQLTVAHKPVFQLYCSEAYQYAHRGTVYPYAMQIERLDGFDGPIHLEVADRQIKDLDGAEVREMTIEPGSFVVHGAALFARDDAHQQAGSFQHLCPRLRDIHRQMGPAAIGPGGVDDAVHGPHAAAGDEVAGRRPLAGGSPWPDRRLPAGSRADVELQRPAENRIADGC